MIKFCSWLSVTTIALAPTLVRAEKIDGATTSAEQTTLPRIISADCYDVHPSPNCELVVLLQNEADPNAADLLIFPNRREGPAAPPVLVVRRAAYVQGGQGDGPRVEQNEGGSLNLNSLQDGVGSPWYQTVTFAHGAQDFIAVSFSYSTYHRITGNSMTCDLNLLTGDARTSFVQTGAAEDGSQDIDDSQTFQVTPPAYPIEDGLSDFAIPDACRDALNAFYQ